MAKADLELAGERLEVPSGHSSFAALTHPDHRSTLQQNLWRPTLTSDSILFRTPFRVIAFDRQNGTVQWSILTDTLGESTTLKDVGGKLNLGRTSSTAELLKTDDLGSVATSDDFVFFIDHFRKLAQRANFRHPQFNPNNQLPKEERAGGTRLVAVQLRPTPRIAWTVGDVEEFPYAVSATADSPHVKAAVKSSAAADAENAEQSKPQFHKQYFTGVPLVHDKTLYLLSTDDEAIWLNSLTESTGRVIWRVPVAYKNEQQSPGRGIITFKFDQPHGASLCGIEGGTLMCALNTGVVVGLSVTDGRFRWATNIRNDDLPSDRYRRSFFARRTANTERPSFQPLLADGRMYWSAQQSDHVYCIDTNTGRILWDTSRSVESVGILEGSQDRYAVARLATVWYSSAIDTSEPSTFKTVISCG